jgi:uncharacterized protein YjiS (DUF1127 family)
MPDRLFHEILSARSPAWRLRQASGEAGTAVIFAARRLISLWRDRRAARQLAELDDRLLKDIGVSRGEVHDALAGPLHRPPSLVLVEIRDRREGRAP